MRIMDLNNLINQYLSTPINQPLDEKEGKLLSIERDKLVLVLGTKYNLDYDFILSSITERKKVNHKFKVLVDLLLENIK